jgi:hypothetical protein
MSKQNYADELKAKFKPQEDYFDLAHKWRGHIIEFTIGLEQQMESFITNHFILAETKEDWEVKALDFKRLFFWNTQMMLSRKKHIAMDLINKYYPMLLTKYPDIEAELTKIIKCRNDMAHWQLDYSNHFRWNGAKNKEIKVNKLDKVNATIYGQQQIDDILDLCRQYTTTFWVWTPET